MLPVIDPHDPWPVVAQRTKRVRLIVVGAGGTGSWLVQHLARLVWAWNRAEALNEEPHPASLLIVDPDHIEAKNVLARQNFCPPEIGYPKAQVVANRYALAFALGKEEIAALVRPFSTSMIPRYTEDLVILIGCVDNAAARAELASCLTWNNHPIPTIWYIDAGNGLHWGQVFVGTTPTLKLLAGCLSGPICPRLPSPLLLAPALFEPPVQEPPTSTTIRLSCGDLVLSEQEGNRQSRTINAHMAGLVYAYVERLLYGSLTTCATYTNLHTFQTHSINVTPLALSNALRQPTEFATVLTTPVPDDVDEDDELAEDV